MKKNGWVGVNGARRRSYLQFIPDDPLAPPLEACTRAPLAGRVDYHGSARDPAAGPMRQPGRAFHSLLLAVRAPI